MPRCAPWHDHVIVMHQCVMSVMLSLLLCMCVVDQWNRCCSTVRMHVTGAYVDCCLGCRNLVRVEHPYQAPKDLGDSDTVILSLPAGSICTLVHNGKLYVRGYIFLECSRPCVGTSCQREFARRWCFLFLVSFSMPFFFVSRTSCTMYALLTQPPLCALPDTSLWMCLHAQLWTSSNHEFKKTRTQIEHGHGRPLPKKAAKAPHVPSFLFHLSTTNSITCRKETHYAYHNWHLTRTRMCMCTQLKKHSWCHSVTRYLQASMAGPR
jgi:hypothetical protein